jgi:peptidoglycan/xylan/chitin deacetylase (PgdA/CDA1 family)
MERKRAALTRQAVVGLTAALALLGAGCGHRSSQISVMVAGSVEHIADDTTLGRAADVFHLRPASGDLLDVQGRVLRAGAFPGSLLINGRRAAESTRLRSGDRIRLLAGRDHKEPLRRRFSPVRGGMPGNPQGTLARTPGVKVIVEGAISHHVVSTHFRPSAGAPKVERAVALTFDDGPSAQDTPRILAILRRMHVRATFFVIGYLVDWYPEVVKREHAAGMMIGNHTYNHPEVPPFNQLPRRLLEAEIALGAESLARVGIMPTLLRPPAGSTSSAVVRAAESSGERVVLWSVDPNDWRGDLSAREIKRRVLSAVRPGSIVILHDGGGERSATIAALPGIIKGIRHKHLRLVPLTP